MTREKLFCTLGTGDRSRTNLQLFSLGQAVDLLDRLKSYIELDTDELRPEERAAKVLEVCVFIVAALGLSVSQLLGQQWSGNGQRVPYPKELLDEFLGSTSLVDEEKKARIRDEFATFLVTYDACRHFGVPKHSQVAGLDLATTEKHMRLVKEIWNLVILDRANENMGVDSIDEVLESGWKHVFLYGWE